MLRKGRKKLQRMNAEYTSTYIYTSETTAVVAFVTSRTQMTYTTSIYDMISLEFNLREDNIVAESG